MRKILDWLKRPRNAALTALGVLLVIAVVTLFHPRVQTALVRDQLAPHLDAFSVARIHLLPWALRIEQLALETNGVAVRLPRADIGIAPWRLLFDVLALRYVEIADLDVDLSDMPASDTPYEPPPGLFALLEQSGYGIALGPVVATARIVTQPGPVLRIRLGGGTIETETEGSINLEVVAEEVAADTRIEVGGALSVGQGEAGRYDVLGVELLALVTSPALPQEDVVALTARATPVRRERPRADVPEKTESVIVADDLTLVLSKPGDETDPLHLHIETRHDVPASRLDGSFRLAANDALVAFYAPQAALPRFDERATGTFALDLRTLRLDFAYAGTAQLGALDTLTGDNQAMPETLALAKSLELSLEDGAVTLESLRATLGETDAAPLLTVEASAPLQIALAAPAALLEQDATLARITLDALPLSWVNGWLSEPAIEAGTLSAAFSLASEGGTLLMAPLDPLRAEITALDERYALSLPLVLTAEPRARYAAQTLEAEVGTIRLAADANELATFAARARLATDAAAGPRITLEGQVDVDQVLTQPMVAARLGDYPLPGGLALAFDGEIALPAGGLRVQTLHATLAQAAGRPLVEIDTLAPVTMSLGEAGARLDNPPGELVLVALDDLDIAWVDPFIADLSVSGMLDGATLTLSTGSDVDTLALRSRAPLSLRRVTIRDETSTLVENLALQVSAAVDYDPEQVELRYTGLDARLGGTALARARGTVTVKLPGSASDGQDDAPDAVAAENATADATDMPVTAHADGHLELDLAGLRRLPQLATALAGIEPARRWRVDADYALGGNASRIDITRLAAAVSVDGESRISVSSASPLVLRPHIAAGEPLARHLTGAFEARIEALDSALINDLVPLTGVAFEALSAHATLQSDGSELSAALREPLALQGVRLSTAEGGDLLHPFSVALTGRLDARGPRATATFDNLALRFDARPEPAALTGSLALTVDPGARVPLRRLDAALGGFLPVLLDQPALLPGHSLRQGRLALAANVAEDGAIGGEVVLDELAADAPLAMTRLTAQASGRMDADGAGFAFRMPITGSGRSGETDGLLTASYAPREAANALLDLELDSRRFLLNDVLASVASIAGAPPPPGAGPAPPADAAVADAPPREPDRTPDETAFWNVLPYDARVRYHVDDLYYTDYVIFNDVQGEIALSPTRFELASLAARFHDSPLTLDGRLDFLGDAAEPYELALDGHIDEFDLNQFFSELVPGTKPRVEGLFSVDIDAHGTSPNMPEYRNELGFDLALRSRDGLFRPLPPDSVLMAGASDVLGIVGEGLSYVPTGGFGAGVVSRLVNYIKVIDYDRIDIHVVRGDSRDIVIEQFHVRSPTVHLTASGGIDYVDGKDILDSPLELDASLNMSGKGAAILYSMDLLEDGEDAYGYAKGPSFRIRGTPSSTESNFTEIVNAAADGTLKGGITRPISGLIGNLKYRWFGDEPDPYTDDDGAEDSASDAASAQAGATDAP